MFSYVPQKFQLLNCPGRGELPEKLCGSLWPTFQNPYPIYDQNLWLLPPYLWPDQKFDISLINVATGTVSLCIICEGLLVMVLPIMMKKQTKMAKINTLFMSKMADNHTLCGRTYLCTGCSPCKGVPPMNCQSVTAYPLPLHSSGLYYKAWGVANFENK